MAPEDLFAGINPERLAMMQAQETPTYERGGRGGQGGRGGRNYGRGGRGYGRDAAGGGYRNGGRAQGNGIETGLLQNGNGNGNGTIVVEEGEETSALEKRAAKKNGGRKPEEKKIEEPKKEVAGDKGSEKKKKRKRDDAADVSFHEFYLRSFSFADDLRSPQPMEMLLSRRKIKRSVASPNPPKGPSLMANPRRRAKGTKETERRRSSRRMLSLQMS